MGNKEIGIGQIGDLQITLSETLGVCSLAIQDAVNQAAEKVGKEAVSKLKATSPKGDNKKHAYSKGWKYKVTKVQADGSFDIKIYNATYGSLTHLLEKGHPLVRNGAVIGRVKAQPHIGPVNDWVQTEGFKQIADAVQKAIQQIKTGG